MEDRPDAAMLQVAMRGARRAGSVEERTLRAADFFRMMLPWLVARGSLFKSIFTGRSATAVRQMAATAEEESPASRLNKVASIPSVSGLAVYRQWLEEAAELAGAPVSLDDKVTAAAQKRGGMRPWA